MGELLLSQNPAPQGQVIMAQESQLRQIVWCSNKKVRKTERNHNIEQVQYECWDALKSFFQNDPHCGSLIFYNEHDSWKTQTFMVLPCLYKLSQEM